MRFLIYSLLLSLISCGSGEVKKNMNDVTYQTSGVEKYFLAELPAWANFSETGSCFKSSSFTYLDLPKVSGAFGLSYLEMLELQAQYNDRVETYFRSTTARFLKPVEQAGIFSNTLEQVKGGVRQLRLPDAREVDLIWLDSFIQKNKMNELKKMAKEGKFFDRLPVVVSTCLSRQEMEKWVSESNFDQLGFYLISAEWFTPYDIQMKLEPGLRINLRQIFKKETKFFLVAPEKSMAPGNLIY
jgi:hypothetical protein